MNEVLARRPRPVEGTHASASPQQPLARYRGLVVWIATTDAVSIIVAMLTAYIIRFGPHLVLWDIATLIMVTPVILVGAFSSFRLYSVQLLGPAEEFRRIIAAIGTVIAAIALFGFWSHIPYSRLWLGMTWMFCLLLCLLTRKGWRRAVGRMRVDGRLAYRTLLIGASRDVLEAMETFRSPALGFRPVAIVALDPDAHLDITAFDHELLAVSRNTLEDTDRLRRVIQDLEVDCVFVVSTTVSTEDVARIAKASRLEGIEARLSLNVPQVLPTRLSVQPLDHLMVVSLRSAHLSPGRAAAKRVVDVLGALFGLLLMTLPCLAIALAIKATSEGPILFRQVRVGRQGRRFTLLKFRTMVQGAEEMLIDLRERNEADGPLFKIREDPRVTSVGRWLRRWSLDELPQFINVLKGDMSLVGPRPPLPEEVARYEDWQRERLEVAPGITGLWQIEGRIELPFHDAVRRDIFYIENWSLSYDLFILVKTLPAIISRRGAC